MFLEIVGGIIVAYLLITLWPLTLVLAVIVFALFLLALAFFAVQDALGVTAAYVMAGSAVLLTFAAIYDQWQIDKDRDRH